MRHAAMLLALSLLAYAGAPWSATPQVSAGGSHTLLLKADGTVLAWGSDAAGQLGQGRPLVASSPVRVSGIPGQVTSLAVGLNHTLALKSDGTVWAWGGNEWGQLGDGSTIDRSEPAQVAGISDVVKVVAGDGFSMVVLRDGSARGWGRNDLGQLGNGTRVDRTAPGSVTGGRPPIVDISAGARQVLAVTSNGAIWGWGSYFLRQGDGSIPTAAPVISGVAKVSARNVIVALKTDGTVWAWADQPYSATGADPTPGNLSYRSPSQLPGLSSIVAISAGGGGVDHFVVALRSDGTVWAWGQNAFGELGAGTFDVGRRTPMQVQGLAGVRQIATGLGHVLALKDDGTVWSWGRNLSGELGNGDPRLTDQARPAQIAGLTDVEFIAGGAMRSFAVKRDGSIWGWGSNAVGELTGGATFQTSVPLVVPGLSGVKALAAGDNTSVALKDDGTVWGWGGGRPSPERIAGLTNITAIDSGVALRGDGSVDALSHSSTGAPTAAPISGLSSVVAVSSGAGRITALGSNGNVAAVTSRGVASVGLSGVVAISGTLALKSDGTVWYWYSPGNFYEVFQVPGITDAVAIASRGAIRRGGMLSWVMRRDGSVWAWGDNDFGALGDGTNRDLEPPGAPVPGLADVASISPSLPVTVRVIPPSTPGGSGSIAYSTYTMAVTRDGSVLAWGANSRGQLGDGTNATRFKPTVVLRENGAGSIATGDWFVDADPAVATVIPAERTPAFKVVTTTSEANTTADIRYRAQDIGATSSLYVFALAPATRVTGAVSSAKAFAKNDAVPCVLAQLSAAGQLQQVSASGLAAYATGVLSAQGASVNVMSAAAAQALAGATVFVGYGTTSTAMINAGNNRGVVSVPGDIECKPQAPQTGWWWNPAEGGRGYSIETQGKNLFMAAYFYEADGRATWLVASGPTSLEGSLFSAPTYTCTGGVTLPGAYRANNCTAGGTMTLAFANASKGTLAWPGGTVPIDRFDIVPGGLAATPQANVPESGWWWSAAESGRGFFIEWQNGSANIAGYMYDDAGNPIWYITVATTPNARAFNSSWWQYANGMTMSGPYRAPTQVSNNVGPTTIQFTSTTTATMTLPGGRQIALTRFRF